MTGLGKREIFNEDD
jgi:hypothetical protein